MEMHTFAVKETRFLKIKTVNKLFTRSCLENLYLLLHVIFLPVYNES